MSFRLAPLAALLLVLALQGCQTLQPSGVPPQVAALPASFEAAGRLSAKRGDAALSAAFRWRHDVAADHIELANPLGQTLATLEGDAGGARATLADGRRAEAPDFRALVREAFGVDIPIEALAAWLRAAPVAGRAADVERDALGRAIALRQDGWQLAYAYPDDAARLPSRVTLAYPDVDIRVVVDAWQ